MLSYARKINEAIVAQVGEKYYDANKKEVLINTAQLLDLVRVESITIKATQVIEERYNPLKQRKMLSIAVALQDKKLQGLTLTADEEALLQSNRDANAWITAIRTIENTAIANGTALDSINWSVV